MIRAAPSAEVRSIDGPHLLLQSRPRESAEAILDFLVASGER